VVAACKHILQMMEKVAEQRALGLRWESAGAVVQRSGETVRRWPALYPDDWDRVYATACRRSVHEAAAEARTGLRVLAARAKSESVRRAAYRDLLQYELKYLELQIRAAAAKQADGETDANDIALVRHVRSLTDQQLDDLINGYHRLVEHAPDAGETGSEPNAGPREAPSTFAVHQERAPADVPCCGCTCTEAPPEEPRAAPATAAVPEEEAAAAPHPDSSEQATDANAVATAGVSPTDRTSRETVRASQAPAEFPPTESPAVDTAAGSFAKTRDHP
jgi:hypothetical protein